MNLTWHFKNVDHNYMNCIVQVLIPSGYFYGASYKSPTTQRHSTDTVSEFHAKAPQATASEGLVQGPYAAARLGFKPVTLGMKGDESTNEPLTLSSSGQDTRFWNVAMMFFEKRWAKT